MESIKKEGTKQGVSELFIDIVESVPSHNAYYAGMLPLIGFEMAPRVRLVAPFDILHTLDVPELPAHIEEVGFSAEKLPGIADVWNQTEMEHYPNCSESEKRRKRAELLKEVEGWSRSEDKVRSLTVLAQNGRIIGFSVGFPAAASKTLDVLELHVAPAFQGRRLGRYLCIRCMQKLHKHFAKPGWRFFVGTFREWQPAMKLYSSLGLSSRR